MTKSLALFSAAARRAARFDRLLKRCRAEAAADAKAPLTSADYAAIARGWADMLAGALAIAKHSRIGTEHRGPVCPRFSGQVIRRLALAVLAARATPWSSPAPKSGASHARPKAAGPRRSRPVHRVAPSRAASALSPAG